MNDEIEYIRLATPETEQLAQLAEECCELAQAALKLRRTYKPFGCSPTPCSVSEAVEHFHEEIADVLVCLQVTAALKEASVIPSVTETMNKKTKRWAQRLGQRKDETN